MLSSSPGSTVVLLGRVLLPYGTYLAPIRPFRPHPGPCSTRNLFKMSLVTWQSWCCHGCNVLSLKEKQHPDRVHNTLQVTVGTGGGWPTAVVGESTLLVFTDGTVSRGLPVLTGVNFWWPDHSFTTFFFFFLSLTSALWWDVQSRAPVDSLSVSDNHTSRGLASLVWWGPCSCWGVRSVTRVLITR